MRSWGEIQQLSWSTAALASAVAILGGLLLLLCLQKRRASQQRYPPNRSGWLPWLGVALEFGRAPLHYIKQCRDELGDIFTIRAAGKNMTFVCGSTEQAYFFETPYADFQEAVQPFTEKAAGIPHGSFFQYHTLIHDTIKGRLARHHMTTMCQALSAKFYQHLLALGKEGKEDLMKLVRATMFPAVVKQLFGADNLALSESEMKELSSIFAAYDADFEYGAELPALLLRQWNNKKNWLLTFFQKMASTISGRKAEPVLLVEHLMKTVDAPSASGYGLLLLWASQANAIPITFWTIAFTLAHKDIHAAITKELKDWQLLDEKGEFIPLNENDLKKFPLVKQAVLEAIRLRAPGTILRKVTKTHTIKGYTIPAGHLLMLSPYWSHRDPDLFPQPDAFIPSRWGKSDSLDKGQFLQGFVGFGGGRYQCPGRWLALMELHLMVTMFLKMFHMQLLEEVPKPSPLHLVGVQQPLASCIVKYSTLLQ